MGRRGFLCRSQAPVTFGYIVWLDSAVPMMETLSSKVIALSPARRGDRTGVILLRWQRGTDQQLRPQPFSSTQARSVRSVANPQLNPQNEMSCPTCVCLLGRRAQFSSEQCFRFTKMSGIFSGLKCCRTGIFSADTYDPARNKRRGRVFCL